jgi:hypothetical protein
MTANKSASLLTEGLVVSRITVHISDTHDPEQAFEMQRSENARSGWKTRQEQKRKAGSIMLVTVPSQFLTSLHFPCHPAKDEGWSLKGVDRSPALKTAHLISSCG